MMRGNMLMEMFSQGVGFTGSLKIKRKKPTKIKVKNAPINF